MKKGYFAAILGVMSLTKAAGQGYEIEAKFGAVKDSAYVLGYYDKNETTFIPKDTAKADARGAVLFKGNTPLPGGLYMILFPGQKGLLQLVVSGDELKFSIETEAKDIVKKMKVQGSAENTIFYDYQRRHGQAIGGAKQGQSLSPEATQQLKALRKELYTKYPKSFTSKLLRFSDRPATLDGNVDKKTQYNYYKNHFWDNFDFSDERLLRTPFLEPRLEQFIKNLVVQVPDSINKEADNLIAMAKDKEIKDYFIYYITKEYENPKVIGTDGVFVHMAEKYYLTGQLEVSDDAKKKVAERVQVMKPLLVGKNFPKLVVTDPQGKALDIAKVPAKMTLVFLYSPTCSHCQETAPKLVEFYNKHKASGLRVVAIATENSPEDWKKFIKDYHFESLLNGYDMQSSIDYRNKFDVYSTPTIYLLDANKKIVARRLPAEEIESFYDFYQKKNSAQAIGNGK